VSCSTGRIPPATAAGPGVQQRRGASARGHAGRGVARAAEPGGGLSCPPGCTLCRLPLWPDAKFECSTTRHGCSMQMQLLFVIRRHLCQQQQQQPWQICSRGSDVGGSGGGGSGGSSRSSGNCGGASNNRPLRRSDRRCGSPLVGKAGRSRRCKGRSGGTLERFERLLAFRIQAGSFHVLSWFTAAALCSRIW